MRGGATPNKRAYCCIPTHLILWRMTAWLFALCRLFHDVVPWCVVSSRTPQKILLEPAYNITNLWSHGGWCCSWRRLQVNNWRLSHFPILFHRADQWHELSSKIDGLLKMATQVSPWHRISDSLLLLRKCQCCYRHHSTASEMLESRPDQCRWNLSWVVISIFSPTLIFSMQSLSHTARAPSSGSMYGSLPPLQTCTTSAARVYHEGPGPLCSSPCLTKSMNQQFSWTCHLTSHSKCQLGRSLHISSTYSCSSWRNVHVEFPSTWAW